MAVTVASVNVTLAALSIVTVAETSTFECSVGAVRKAQPPLFSVAYPAATAPGFHAVGNGRH